MKGKKLCARNKVKLELSYTAGGYEKQQSHFGKVCQL